LPPIEVQSSEAACSIEPQAVKPTVRKTIRTKAKRNFDDFIPQVYWISTQIQQEYPPKIRNLRESHYLYLIVIVSKIQVA
jgi:hypothetical protein